MVICFKVICKIFTMFLTEYIYICGCFPRITWNLIGKDVKFMGAWPLKSAALAERCQLDDLISEMH